MNKFQEPKSYPTWANLVRKVVCVQLLDEVGDLGWDRGGGVDGPVTGGGHARIPSWTNAVDQARAAARALIRGEDAPRYEPSYYFWTEQFGLDIKISGALVPDTELTVDNDWQTADAALLTWGDAAAPHRVLGWNHHLRPAQLKRMTRGADRVGTV